MGTAIVPSFGKARARERRIEMDQREGDVGSYPDEPRLLGYTEGQNKSFH